MQLPPATMVTSTASLKAHVDRWAQEKLLAIDTESNSLHAYQEQVCLIQLSTRETDYIIDPLLIENLDPLGELTADPKIEVIFHAAEYDVMCMKRDFNFEFARLFDTMLAARICGAEHLGLARMLRDHFGVKVNKKYQRANWGERPIPGEMLLYAQLDTHYLPALRDYWKQQLLNKGHWEEALELFDELARTPAANHHSDPEGYWRINGAHRLHPKQMAVLRQLYLMRDKIARQRDAPTFKIMGDKTLLELATEQPRHTGDLRLIHGMTSKQIRRYGRAILEAIEQGQYASIPERPPAPPRPHDDVVARFEALRMWRKERAKQRGVESDVIVSRDALWAIARQAPETVEELAEISAIGPWKRRTYGKEIVSVIVKANNHNGRHHR